MTTPDPRLREALARLVRDALTDDALDVVDTDARKAANHTEGFDLDAYWQAWRNGIADRLDGPLAEAWERFGMKIYNLGWGEGEEAMLPESAEWDAALRALEEPGEETKE